MRAEVAAAYVGLSVGTLEREGPPAVFLTRGCKVWLIEDLDAWLDKRAGKTSGLRNDRDELRRRLRGETGPSRPVRATG